MELFCPHCKQPLKVMYDERHDETYCSKCGVILRCPPNSEIILPNIIREEMRNGG